MVVPPEAFDIAAAVVSLAVVALYYHIRIKLQTWHFTFAFLCAAAMAVSLLMSMVATAVPSSGAVADVGVLLAGCAAFASSAGLCFAFKMAGEPGDG